MISQKTNPGAGNILSFIGPETFRLHEHVQQYFQAAQQKYGEYNVAKIDPQETDLETLKSELLSPPFFGNGKRVFFLQPFPFESSGRISEEKKEMAEKLLELLKNLDTDTVVICVCANPDRRLKAWKDLEKIADKENSREFPELKEDQLTEWILQFVSKKNGKILPGAAEYLWQYAGNNLWTLAHEIEKLVALAEEKPISERDIREVCAPSFETVQFALANAFSGGGEEEVSLIFQRMVEAGESGLAILLRDFGSIMRQFLLVKYALENKKSAPEIKVAPFIFGRVKKAVAEFSFEHLRKMHRKLVEIDEGAKTGQINVSSHNEGLLMLALEQWIREFFQVARSVSKSSGEEKWQAESL